MALRRRVSRTPPSPLRRIESGRPLRGRTGFDAGLWGRWCPFDSDRRGGLRPPRRSSSPGPPPPPTPASGTHSDSASRYGWGSECHRSRSQYWWYPHPSHSVRSPVYSGITCNQHTSHTQSQPSTAAIRTSRAVYLTDLASRFAHLIKAQTQVHNPALKYICRIVLVNSALVNPDFH